MNTETINDLERNLKKVEYSKLMGRVLELKQKSKFRENKTNF